MLALTLACASASSDVKTFINPSLASANVRRVAILPIPTRRLTPQETGEMNHDFIRAFVAANPGVVVMDEAISARALSDASLAERYGAFLRGYGITGIPNQQLLADIGQALHVDAIIQGEVIEIIQRHELLDVQAGETSVTIRYRMTGTRTPSILWEGSGHASAGKRELVRRVPPLPELIAAAEQEVIMVIPKLAN